MSSSKAEYVSPTLQKYGGVEELTATNDTNNITDTDRGDQQQPNEGLS
jgi:hypothetical protein